MMVGLDGHMTTLGWIGMALFWIVVLGLIVWAVVRLSKPSAPEPAPLPEAVDDDPLIILDRRLARGEVDPDDYDVLREKLSHATPVGV